MSQVGSTLTSNMKARVQATRRVLSEAGASDATALPVLAHNDATGTRPDVMVASGAHVHPAVLRYLAAHHGLLHGMPGVVAFNSHPSGPDKVHVIHSGLEQAAVIDAMRRAGLPKFSVHKNVVYLFDPGSNLDLSHLLGPLNASQYHAIAGHGRVVGAGEGADAAGQRAAYRDVIRAAESVAARAAGAQGTDPAALKLARPAFPHGRLWTSEPEDTAGFVDKYLSARGSKRTTAPLAAMADRFAEQHGDHPIGKWLPWIVSHPDVKVTKGATAGYPGHWSEIGVESTRLVDGKPAIVATIRDGRKRREVRLHVPVTTPETAAALRELHADLGGHEHTPYNHEAAGRALEETLGAMKLARKTPETVKAFGGQWKLPADAVQALYDHATGTAPLSDAEVVRHLTRHPHPVAGRIFGLGAQSVRVTRRPAGYVPESHQAAGALDALRGGGHISHETYQQGFRGNLEETKARAPGELFHSGEATDALLHHAPSNSWLAVSLDHDDGDAGVTPEHMAQHARAKAALAKPIIRRFTERM